VLFAVLTDQGERGGVQFFQKPDPEDSWGVPYVKGKCLVKDVTTDEFVGVILLEGMRKSWDPRFESGSIVSRSVRKFSFHG
jgi:hypothetical protein